MSNTTSEPLLLTVQEAAHRLGLDRSALYPRVMRGEIVSIRIGRSRRIPATALSEYVARLIAEQNGDRLPTD